MTTDIHWFRERLGSASVPWPVLVAAGPAAVAILLASRTTTAEAAGLGVPTATPAPHAQTLGVVSTVSDTVRGVLHGQNARLAPARTVVRPVVHQVVEPVTTVTRVIDPTIGDMSKVLNPVVGTLNPLQGQVGPIRGLSG